MAMGESGKPWVDEEVEACVATYFDMLEMDVQGIAFVKAAVYRDLSSRFPARSDKSFGRKMSNISAILVGLGYPHLRGLAPQANYQSGLVEAVLGELTRRTSLDVVLENSVAKTDALGPVDIIRETTAPAQVITDILHGQGIARPFRRDFLALEAANQALGLAGELAVVRREQEKLRRSGQSKLADRVEHVSQTLGDGLGYDVLSFDPTGREKLIEVKTTKYSIDVPFFVSRGEVRASRRTPELYHLYRLFGFGGSSGTGLYQLQGDLGVTCNLDALIYAAAPRAAGSSTVSEPETV
ncbi:DUF3883 domain-containing protein [Pseudarthrobacter sp. J1763]|uniref:DUF3883 domain-containing protein n=1 Tax=Pseudarthrobacter sp. J1763 TaxID=3420445 RepID=UPI003D2BF986